MVRLSLVNLLVGILMGV
ncbi:hypothetical protein CFP56_023039 [Quercus suber]|uniref:Uncharacterized protein n=1 Tax=Quercus suber TaxID=58331 RepID=A0AAW0KB56_QUESU